MSIVNKRNAVVGWATLKFGKKYGPSIGRILARDQADKVTRKLRRRRRRH